MRTVGLAVYYRRHLPADRATVRRVAGLLVDPRWPWIPWYARFVGVDPRDDQSAVRVGGKNGAAPLVKGMMSPKLTSLRMVRAMADDNHATATLDFGATRATSKDETPYELLITLRSSELPPGKSFDEWLTLAHELVTAVDARHATLGAWPTYDLAMRDTWHTRVVLDTPNGDAALNALPEDLDEQIDLTRKWNHHLATYARHPRWGNYLNAGHLAAIGGVERIRAEVEPARLEAVGELTYIQLTDSIDTALSPLADGRRRRLQALMAPILVGAATS